MIKNLELSDPNSCINRAEPNEPVFVLRANDESAPETVRKWIHRYCFDRGGGGGYNSLTPKQKSKVDEASELAHQMEQWRRAKYSK